MDYHSVPPADWLNGSSTPEDVSNVVAFLKEQGTFQFKSLPNGLFPAASGFGADFEATGYRNIWVRDNVHVAFAHFRVGEVDVAVRCVEALASFFSKHRSRLEDVILGKADHADPMQRPHIRFNGEHLIELDEKWAHAQNDALGYFLWIYGLLVTYQAIPLERVDWELVALFIHYFQVIRYWEDEDSGHWEETRKISASSIGVVKESLNEWHNLLTHYQPQLADRLLSTRHPVSLDVIGQLHDRGEAALAEILPAECIQEDPKKKRRYDGALVFLCYPLNAVDRNMQDRILDEVTRELSGAIGIRRYQGDSYWCADYKDFLSADKRSADFSDDLSGRDALLKPGTEAQWCIFDPAISCAYGLRYAKDHAKKRGLHPIVLEKQLHHLKRSLAQLSPKDHPKGPYRCPESYFRHRGDWIPNDITPLLWTQGNLLQALWWLENNLKLVDEE